MNYDPNEHWYYQMKNFFRRLFNKPEVRLMTDNEWRRYMDSLIPSKPPKNIH